MKPRALPFLKQPLQAPGRDERLNLYRITLAGMRTEGWLLVASWTAGGLVLGLLGFWAIGLLTSTMGLAVDAVIQRRLKALWTSDLREAEAGFRVLAPLVAVRFSLGVLGSISVVLTDPDPANVAVILMLQAWSICVAMAQFSAAPRLFAIAIAPPLLATVCALWPLLFSPDALAVVLSLVLLVSILAVIGRQVGQVWQAWAAAWDERAELIETLEAARMAADAASTAKTNFLATMSHEVRTPLNGILGMTQLMALKEQDDEKRSRLEVIQRSGQALLGTLNSILDLARIEAGRLDLIEAAFQPSQIVQDSFGAFEPSASLKGVTMSVEAQAEAQRFVLGDALRVRQIIDNLVGNAVKFTQKGRIELSVARIDDLLMFEVLDTGAGIAAADLKRIFNPFEQADGTSRRDHEGSGLGLSICHELAALMGGRIEAASVLGQGSRFRLVMPAVEASPPEQAKGEVQTEIAAAFSVLVVEDNVNNQLVVRGLLEHLGASVDIAGNGLEALAALRLRCFDVVLMDVQMPILDGLEATRAIRRGEAGSMAALLPIIGVTGNAMDHQVNEALEAGMTTVVSKPIQLPQLVAAIETVLTDVASQAAAREEAAA